MVSSKSGWSTSTPASSRPIPWILKTMGIGSTSSGHKLISYGGATGHSAIALQRRRKTQRFFLYTFALLCLLYLITIMDADTNSTMPEEFGKSRAENGVASTLTNLQVPTSVSMSIPNSNSLTNTNSLESNPLGSTLNVRAVSQPVSMPAEQQPTSVPVPIKVVGHDDPKTPTSKTIVDPKTLSTNPDLKAQSESQSKPETLVSEHTSRNREQLTSKSISIDASSSSSVSIADKPQATSTQQMPGIGEVSRMVPQADEGRTTRQREGLAEQVPVDPQSQQLILKESVEQLDADVESFLKHVHQKETQALQLNQSLESLALNGTSEVGTAAVAANSVSQVQAALQQPVDGSAALQNPTLDTTSTANEIHFPWSKSVSNPVVFHEHMNWEYDSMDTLLERFHTASQLIKPPKSGLDPSDPLTNELLYGYIRDNLEDRLLNALALQAKHGDCSTAEQHIPGGGLFKTEEELAVDDLDRNGALWGAWCTLRNVSKRRAIQHFLHVIEVLMCRKAVDLKNRPNESQAGTEANGVVSKSFSTWIGEQKENLRIEFDETPDEDDDEDAEWVALHEKLQMLPIEKSDFLFQAMYFQGRYGNCREFSLSSEASRKEDPTGCTYHDPKAVRVNATINHIPIDSATQPGDTPANDKGLNVSSSASPLAESQPKEGLPGQKVEYMYVQVPRSMSIQSVRGTAVWGSWCLLDEVARPDVKKQLQQLIESAMPAQPSNVSEPLEVGTSPLAATISEGVQATDALSSKASQ